MAMKRVDPALVTTRAAGVTITQIGVSLGAEVSDIDLTRPVGPEQFAALEAALVEHELLVFRNQSISSDDLMRFGRLFGELTVHPFAPAEGANPELIKFRNDEHSAPFGTDVWHSDETFRAEPPMATALCAKEVPVLGGDTVFASMTAAFEGLSDRMQQFISGLEAVHDLKPFKVLFGDSPAERDQLHEYEKRYPPYAHPVVRVHPTSGRKALFVNPNFTIRIKDMDERESRALLDTLFQQTLIPEYQYRLRWAPHTLAFWDNRSTQHYAVHDYYPQKRYMERVTIRGGPVVGVEATNRASTRKIKFDIPAGVDPYGGHKPHAAD
jgi:alpha-ketoglutarate-dependent taurine dioxygenase